MQGNRKLSYLCKSNHSVNIEPTPESEQENPGGECRKCLLFAGSPCPALPLSKPLGSPGRLSAEPGRWQRPCPGTQPLGHSRDPALHHSPGHPCRCPAAPSPPRCTSHERHPGSSWPGRDVLDPGAPSRNLPCTVLQPESYRMQSCEGFSCTELLSACTLRAAWNPFLPGCLRSEPPALLRCAEELLLGRAVSLHQGPLATSSLCPRSPAQLSSRGPAQGIGITPLVALVMRPRTSGTERQLKKSLKKSEEVQVRCKFPAVSP